MKNVHVVDPDYVGITDFNTDEVVATLRSATPITRGDGVPGLSLDFVGSDDVCEHPADYPVGWFGGSSDVEIAFDTERRVRFREYYGTGMKYLRERPARIHGGSDFGWAGIRWSRWGGRVAKGRGYYYYVDKKPSGYRQIRYPLKFELSRPEECDGGLRYLRMQTTRLTRRPATPGVPRRNAIDLTCDEGMYG